MTLATPWVSNREIYNRPDVAAHYAELSYLTACERHLLDRYIKPGAAVLDLGVGGGRTTPYLSSKASRYVGVDYAPEMIHTCRGKFPGLEFLVAEASNLFALEACSFDAVVCAFNGLDYVIPDEARVQCFKECHRVLRPDGVFIFSSHNPRSILLRPVWNQAHVRKIAENFGGAHRVATDAAYFFLSLAAGGRALLRAAWRSAGRMIRRLPRVAFRNGEGYMFDTAHGGLMTHYSIPTRTIAELQQHGFRPLRVLGDDYPLASRLLATDWYYYVFSKSKPARDGEACA